MKFLIATIVAAVSLSVFAKDLQLLEGKTRGGRKCHIRLVKSDITSDYIAYDNNFYFYSRPWENKSASTYVSSFESSSLDEMKHLFTAEPGKYEHDEYDDFGRIQYVVSINDDSVKEINIKPLNKQAYVDELYSYFEMTIKMKGNRIISFNRKYYRSRVFGLGLKRVFNKTCIINQDLNI